MKTLLTVLSIFIFWQIQAQNFIESSCKEPDYNSFGKPSHNLIDPNGAKQGDWFYVNNSGKTVLKAIYSDNVLQTTYYKDASNGWKLIEKTNYGFNLNNDKLNVRLKEILGNSSDSSSNEKQLIVVCDNNEDSSLITFFLGDWNNKALEQTKQLIKNHKQAYKNYSLTNKSTLYVY